VKEELPIVCTLGAGELARRLAAIAEIGEASLIGRKATGGRHLLRFRRDDRTRRQLETIVEAEAECCPFLDLELEEEGTELILSIAAHEEGGPVADQLSAAFAEGAGPEPSAA
jgi:hypothetical protein